MGIRMIEFSRHGDARGELVVAECGDAIPFEVKRIFYIYGSDTDVVRGQHANRRTQFVLVNVAGTCKVRVKICGGGGWKKFIVLTARIWGCTFLRWYGKKCMISAGTVYC